MKKSLLFIRYFILLLIPSATVAQGQQKIRCGTTEYMNYLQQKDPGLSQRLIDAEQTVQQWISNNPNFRMAGNVTDTIPVVVHVVYKTSVQNISDAQVISQIDVLNEDYARKNADTVNTPAVWQSVAGSMPYYFVLARRDPAGNPTNGIVRKLTTANSFSLNNNVKFDSQSGSDAWDVTKYFNIWVCNLGGGILGYAELPNGTPSNTFGFVCEYNSFGRVGSVTPPYNLGRTTTHEIGHCFNLQHIWGNDAGDCTGTDYVGDTPNQADENYGCQTFPHTDACSPASPGVMYMNYMDYGDDNCLNMFTNGQTTRMIAALNSFYPGIVNSDGLLPGVQYANNASIFEIVSPGATVCDPAVTSVVTIQNWGSNTLSSVNVNYSIDSGPVNTFNWTGSLAQNAFINVTLPSINVTPGLHTLTIFTSMPNGVADSSTVGDTSNVSFTVNNTTVPYPLTEGFQSTFPPANWSYTVLNSTNKWLKVNNAGGFGLSTSSAKMDNFSGSTDVSGQIDDMLAPMVDISSVTGSIVLNFSVAYAQYNSSSVDSLVVHAQAGCSGNAQRVYAKGGAGLSTVIPQTGAFTPTAVQWRTETVNLNSFMGQSLLKLTFRSVSDWGNNIYVDDIGFELNPGVDEVSEASLLIYPNPVDEQVIIQSNFFETAKYEISLVDALGRTENTLMSQNGNKVVLNTSTLPAGIYFVNIKSDVKSYTKKIIINH